MASSKGAVAVPLCSFLLLSLSLNLIMLPLPRATAACNTLNLGVCAKVLNGLLNLELGAPPKEPCCSLISGLADVEAAACVCTALKASLMGLNLTLPLNLSLLVNYCGTQVPAGFQCP